MSKQQTTCAMIMYYTVVLFMQPGTSTRAGIVRRNVNERPVCRAHCLIGHHWVDLQDSAGELLPNSRYMAHSSAKMKFHAPPLQYHSIYILVRYTNSILLYQLCCYIKSAVVYRKRAVW